VVSCDPEGIGGGEVGGIGLAIGGEVLRACQRALEGIGIAHAVEPAVAFNLFVIESADGFKI